MLRLPAEQPGRAVARLVAPARPAAEDSRGVAGSYSAERRLARTGSASLAAPGEPAGPAPLRRALPRPQGPPPPRCGCPAGRPTPPHPSRRRPRRVASLGLAGPRGYLGMVAMRHAPTLPGVTWSARAGA